MIKKIFSGKTSEEALEKASQSFGVEKNLLSYSVVNQSNQGFFAKLFSRGIQIEAWVSSNDQDLKAAAREAVRQAFQKKQSPEKKFPSCSLKDPEVKKLLQDYAKEFFFPFQVSPDHVHFQWKEQDVVICIQDEFLEKMLSKSDKLSMSFEHVFKRMAQKKYGDVIGRITLDAGSAVENREERLIEMAKSLAEKVKKTGKSVVLSSKSSQERRVIHLAIEQMEGVATKSSGSGDKRRLIIYSTSVPMQKHKRKKQHHGRPQQNK